MDVQIATDVYRRTISSQGSRLPLSISIEGRIMLSRIARQRSSQGQEPLSLESSGLWSTRMYWSCFPNLSCTSRWAMRIMMASARVDAVVLWLAELKLQMKLLWYIAFCLPSLISHDTIATLPPSLLNYDTPFLPYFPSLKSAVSLGYRFPEISSVASTSLFLVNIVTSCLKIPIAS